MSAPNAKTRNFKGATALTTANAKHNLAVAVTVGNSGVGTRQTVNTTTTDGADLLGAYVANPGDEDNNVDVAVSGEFEIAMKAAVTTADLNNGVVASDTAGKGKPAVATSLNPLGRIIDFRDAGAGQDPQYFATIIV